MQEITNWPAYEAEKERTKEFYEKHGQQQAPKHHNKATKKRKPRGKPTHRKK